MNYHPAAFRPKRSMGPMVVGTGKDAQFNPEMWEKWNEDACRDDPWKHGRTSNLYRANYDQINWGR